MQRGGELRPTRQRVVPLAGLDLGKFGRVTKPSRLANCSFVARCAYLAGFKVTAAVEKLALWGADPINTVAKLPSPSITTNPNDEN